jgi:hypothetical protein
VEENLSHRSSRASILEKFNKTIETPQPDKRRTPAVTADYEPRFTNYGILDNFKNKAAQGEPRESVSESVVEAKTPSRRDVLLSPRTRP